MGAIGEVRRKSCLQSFLISSTVQMVCIISIFANIIVIINRRVDSCGVRT